jgi:hypothetical protein
VFLWVVIAVLQFVVVQADTRHQSERPELLPAKEGCEVWIGKAYGNDPTIRMQLRLCPDGEAVTGEVQWSSLTSGWNLREVKGKWDEAHKNLLLKDVAIIENQPVDGWKFCLIDNYYLTKNGQFLRGTYSSESCKDRAMVDLKNILEEDDTTVDTTANEKESVSRFPSNCTGCSQTRNASTDWWMFVFLVLIFLRRRV